MRLEGRRSTSRDRTTGGVGIALWAALVGTLVAMGLFAHLRYGASALKSLIGIGTTVLVLLAVLAIAHVAERRRG